MADNHQLGGLTQERLANQYTADELKEQGKQHRQTRPIKTLATVTQVDRDPVQFINAVESHLIKSLLPMRHQRMAASPAAFFRGTAELMSYDLSQTASADIPILIDGDSHLQNFGFYASPERNLLFDVNDFDEAHIDSFEFDVKRLLTSIYLLGDQQGFAAPEMDDIVQTAASIYRKTLRDMFKLSALDRFYQSTEIDQLLEQITGAAESELLNRFTKKATKRNGDSVIKKYTELDASGQIRFTDDPPRSVHVDAKTYQAVADGFAAYQKTTRADIGVLLSQYTVTDIIHHSVGIGSFGSSSFLILLSGMGGSYLVLQVKEALPIRRQLMPDAAKATLAEEISEGQRIIAAQMILQKASDPFLGWFNIADKSYYVRQFRDMKASVDITELSFDEFRFYTQVTARLLAMAHAQSPQAAVVNGYLDKNFDTAVAGWSKWYLDQVKSDYAAFMRALDQHLLA